MGPKSLVIRTVFFLSDRTGRSSSSDPALGQCFSPCDGWFHYLTTTPAVRSVGAQQTHYELNIIDQLLSCPQIKYVMSVGAQRLSVIKERPVTHGSVQAIHRQVFNAENTRLETLALFCNESQKWSRKRASSTSCLSYLPLSNACVCVCGVSTGLQWSWQYRVFVLLTSIIEPKHDCGGLCLESSVLQ